MQTHGITNTGYRISIQWEYRKRVLHFTRTPAVEAQHHRRDGCSQQLTPQLLVLPPSQLAPLYSLAPLPFPSRGCGVHLKTFSAKSAAPFYSTTPSTLIAVPSSPFAPLPVATRATLLDSFAVQHPHHLRYVASGCEFSPRDFFPSTDSAAFPRDSSACHRGSSASPLD